jgi:signal transduction histidine kinase
MIKQKAATINYEALPIVNGAPELLYQLFYNIIYNGLKFSKEDVAAVISIEAVNIANGLAAVAVTDNGIGFENENAQKIFDTFTRLNAKDKFEGTGLGLALCKRIIERHGGEIKASGLTGVGATFTLTLPLAPALIKNVQ